MLLGGGNNTTDDADQDISFMNFAGGFFGTTGFMLDGSWDTDTRMGRRHLCAFGGCGSGVQGPEQLLHRAVWMEHRQRRQRGHQVGHQHLPWRRMGLLPEREAECGPLLLDIQPIAFSRGNRRSGRRPALHSGLYKQREKTFIFGLYEYLTISTPTVDTYTVPTTNFLSGNFSRASWRPGYGQQRRLAV